MKNGTSKVANSTIAIDHFNEMKGDFTIGNTTISILGKCVDGTLNLEFTKGNDEWTFENVAADFDLRNL
tara:strand:+ start:221 stop:427 length:207 start_codon:yes stop_codon:yes gene_type:complete